MKKMLMVSCLLMSSMSFAGITPEMLADTLSSPEIKKALSDQDIDSARVIYDKSGRTAFDFTLIICGQSTDESFDPPTTIFKVTKIAGSAIYSHQDLDQAITQSTSKKPDSLCH